MYYLLDFESNKEKTVKSDFVELQKLILNHDSGELLYRDEEKTKEGWFSNTYDVTVVFSGDDTLFKELKNYFVSANSLVTEAREVHSANYNFRSLNKYDQFNIKNTQHFFNMNMKVRKRHANGDLNWNLVSTYETRSNKPGDQIPETYGLDGSVYGDVGEVFGARNLIHSYDLDLKFEGLSFS